MATLKTTMKDHRQDGINAVSVCFGVWASGNGCMSACLRLASTLSLIALLPTVLEL